MIDGAGIAFCEFELRGGRQIGIIADANNDCIASRKLDLALIIHLVRSEDQIALLDALAKLRSKRYRKDQEYGNLPHIRIDYKPSLVKAPAVGKKGRFALNCDRIVAQWRKKFLMS